MGRTIAIGIVKYGKVHYGLHFGDAFTSPFDIIDLLQNDEVDEDTFEEWADTVTDFLCDRQFENEDSIYRIVKLCRDEYMIKFEGERSYKIVYGF